MRGAADSDGASTELEGSAGNGAANACDIDDCAASDAAHMHAPHAQDRLRSAHVEGEAPEATMSHMHGAQSGGGQVAVGEDGMAGALLAVRARNESLCLLFMWTIPATQSCMHVSSF